MEGPERIIFYALDKAIKTYRQHAQRRLTEAGLGITVDQWLVLNALEGDPGLPQSAIAERVFKDAASVTRIIDLLITKGLLTRHAHEEDRRRFLLRLSPAGRTLLRTAGPIVERYRSDALKGVSPEDMKRMRATLDLITQNCQ